MTQCLSKKAESPLKYEKRLSGAAVPTTGEPLLPIAATFHARSLTQSA
jgi:hypothetical protein